MSHYANSSNWAGGMLINNTTNVDTYYNAQLRWTQPAFDTVCNSTSKMSIWAGLGGWNPRYRLIQMGTDSNIGSQSPFFWWEILNPGYDTHEVSMPPSVSNGNYVGAKAQYSGGVATFTAWNFTTGAYNTASVSSVNGQSVSAYYDGSTADFISERPFNFGTGSLFDLKKPLSAISFPYALANDQAIRAFEGWNISEYVNHTLQNSTFNADGAWTNSWFSCT